MIKKSSFFKVLIIVHAMLLFGFSSDQDEYTIKALFVYNFTKYIDWPEENIKNKFVIGIYGESKIKDKLSDIIKDKKFYNRAIEIKEIKSMDDISNCQILFISKYAGDKVQAIINRFSQSEILIITEDKLMAQKGSGINIIEKDQRIKFEIYDSALKKSKLKIASQLYELAIVK